MLGSVPVQPPGSYLYLDVCRSLDASVELFYYPYSTGASKTKTIKAIPIKKDYADEVHNTLLTSTGPEDLKQKMLEVCKKAADYKLTDPSERAGTILLCMAE
ncbi:MAG: hypothetical protein HZB66_00675 [Candidatus Aenigmarchaeota archaeon]|nr:hypothetical protein [Candidatus Aenigmarchaeota archaeon]